ncbi:hypothetical protein M514_05560 [Trichuris suis]|uniref:Par3/HAL N-terminal domain-containing protein n=1 Tax=Trichuris suis TaxID=68888 RepID=A0A085M8U8_9BILA|nr:hypothetical protein M513_05560 [Trichuris suis]KFD62636.1 hypothetical protein M514_05560 [Trichuris suis]
MKVTVYFGPVRIVVPVQDDGMLVKDLIGDSIRRYKKVCGKIVFTKAERSSNYEGAPLRVDIASVKDASWNFALSPTLIVNKR